MRKRKNKSFLKIALYVVLIILILIQFLPSNQIRTATGEPNSDLIASSNLTESESKMIKNACYDCHSNEVSYPWYSSIAPVSWWINSHIEEAQEHVNFSLWTSYSVRDKLHILEECAEEVAKSEMPLRSYTLMHSEADLTEVERKELVDLFKNLEIRN